MGLNLTDGAKLLKNGYSLKDIKELNQVLDAYPDNGNDIVELAKKLSFSDLQSALTLFNVTSADNNHEDDNHSNEEDGQDHPEDNGENQNNDTSGDEHQAGDDIDYKKLYEEEHNLRTQLQQNNQNKDMSGSQTKKSAYDIALEIATDALN